ncbi:excinuclease ABC subunit UvrC [Gracilinema caldarium]|uniref:UvrABC system protein C n=1 Tax=Gracilinema caldarium (strain ATCC 51460 / DSM 7334 / H1) TaxID=744872 RepID=F8F135_GRAC1|nr:excinuclease ABC subunit UvrC [Gracilinema caldarium]AEJ20825.1 UvrABC system protein C [Gracilinema caldarium DSM 7334]
MVNRSQNIEHYTRLRAFVKEAPLEPGVYLMKDEAGTIIYVGKAKVLRNRLTSYFSGEKDVKTRTLLTHVRSIETIIVASEYEALLLENTLIKQHSPRYNINLKDGKTYPVVRITNEDFPRLFRTRYIVQDRSRYFGPFPNVQALDTMLYLIETLFPLRKCKVLRDRSHPCMYYHIGRCSAPCAKKISKPEYLSLIEKAIQLLTGNTEDLLVKLTKEMEEAAAQLHFERAAQLRDAINSIQQIMAISTVVDFDEQSRDYIAWAESGILSTYTVFSMRGGKMTGRELYRTRSAADSEESLIQFMLAYYSLDRPPPPQVYINLNLTMIDTIVTALKERFGYAPEIRLPDEKRHEAVLAMAYQNAKEDVLKRQKERGAGPALEELQRILALPRYPERIEGFDIAQLGGKHTVASLISFKNGIPDKKNYRYFKIRSLHGAIDDFGALREAVSRRYSRLLAEHEELPDLILIDGGIGQVNASKGVLDALNISVPVVGLAKRNEELWLPEAKEPIRLDERSEALKVLQHVRDETHRFATALNQRLRSKDLSLSHLVAVPGIGPRKAATLINHFGSLKAIAEASPQDIIHLIHCSEAVALAVQKASIEAEINQTTVSEQFGYHTRVGQSDIAASLAAEAAEWYNKEGKQD